MDENKLEKLKDIDYTVRRVCGNCKYYKLAQSSSRWSDCKEHQYEHKKHSGGPRDLSVNLYGHCNKHEWNNRVIGQMHAYAQLIKE